ncbi:Abi family protein [Brevundimonas intermedia]|uniref:Abi family protein n=1 Tax=Brevundimonas intermedia TaxID=74315 RepID=A0A4Y9RZM6_9CAUL|nr:Abi family protein [Brevundimonas intermedia]
MVHYTKPHLTVIDQVALLQRRGLGVTDAAAAERALSRIGYYRLSGYWYPMRRPNPRGGRQDDFLAQAAFVDAVDLYVFDKKLRLLFLDAIERLEVALRVAVALQLGAYDPWFHRDPSKLDAKFTTADGRTGRSKHDEWLSRLDASVGRSKEEFVRHFQSRYTSELPIWIAIELWDFGLLSHFVSGMALRDRDRIAGQMGLPRSSLLTSWVRAINDLRNICAHHGRLWNRVFISTPSLPRVGEIPSLDHLRNIQVTKLYAVAAVLRQMLLAINPGSQWHDRLKIHLQTFPQSPLLHMSSTGFPLDWERLDLWN